MKKELKSGILSADKSADCRRTVGGANVIAVLDLNLSIHNDRVSTNIYDKRDDFNFDIVNFPFLDGDVPRRP